MSNAGDLGRRIAERREALGLSVEEVAVRSRIDATYLAGLERRPWAAVPGDTLVRLARALETTVEALGGGGTQVPPGRQDTGSGAPLLELDEEECRRLIAGGGVGRVVFAGERGPVAIPVNFTVDGDDVVFRTVWDAEVVQLGPEAPVSFEVDNLDGPLAEGWSVLLTGRCTVEPMAEEGVAADVRPWAAGHRDAAVRLHPAKVTGRRIRRPAGGTAPRGAS
ncbi:MAG TPA: pyridoxamine 5'-phosphate oxidase family protein [Acidimicrobiales bacterium]|nr:pyridoxamine 5'-phosphate oxidase family protein [Acidimicrobiales bacterium]